MITVEFNPLMEILYTEILFTNGINSDWKYNMNRIIMKIIYSFTHFM